MVCIDVGWPVRNIRFFIGIVVIGRWLAEHCTAKSVW